ncbi:MAG: zincin-like metallopeptidase domain-containing protein [Synechococcaceae cyanobacterium]|nr:zincin-like metallopeptidase domain-containing protein [Synechococcaceae cyanobacterium]
MASPSAQPPAVATEPGAAPGTGAAAAPLQAEQRLLANVLAMLEAGTSPWRREWDGAGGGHHLNLVNGHRYRGVNPILLTLGLQARQVAAGRACELKDLPYWCGYATARALGLHPRAGSCAIHILRPQRQHRRAVVAAHPEASSQQTSIGPVSDPVESPRGGQAALTSPGSWIRYRPVAVFHVSDLEGEALAALVARRQALASASLRAEPERLELAERVLSQWPVQRDLGGAMACYLPALDRIQLPVRSAFHSPAAFYATWAHEAVHSTGHASRLNRDLSGCLGGEASAERTYAREELIAELGAMLIGDRLEIGSDTANHAAYLSHWIALLQESPRALYQVLGEARRAADLVAPEPEELAGGGLSEA